MPTNLDAALPATVQVVFPATRDGIPVEDTYSSAITLSGVAVSLFGVPATGFSGTKVLFSQVVATFVGIATSPSNAAALNALALQWGSDYYAYAVGRADVTLSGIQSWTPDGFTDTIEWHHTPEGVFTRVLRGPWLEHTNGSPSSEFFVGSASTCRGFTGTKVSWEYRCVFGFLQAWKAIDTYRCGTLYNVGVPVYSHNEGCCACSGSGPSSFWWCLEPPSSGSGGGSGCTFCVNGEDTPELTVTIVSGCDLEGGGHVPPRIMGYYPLGVFGPGWYNLPDSFGGHTLSWFMPCIEDGSDTVVVYQVVDGVRDLSGMGTILSCSPFDSGEITLATDPPCSGATTVRITE